MERFLQIAALCVICAVLSLVVRGRSPEFSFCAACACCAVSLIAAAELVSPVVSFLQRLQRLAGLEPALLAPVLKTVGVGLLTQIAGAFGRDAGEQALCKVGELCGTFLAVYVALPLANAVLELLQTLMGG